MPLQNPLVVPRTSALANRLIPDRRRHKRIAVALLGRFMRTNTQEYPCKLVDVSVGGAAMMSPVDVEDGERIVAYFDQLGGLEGTVTRLFEGGFAINLIATQHKREKLAAQLMLIINSEGNATAADRRHQRIIPKDPKSNLQLANGTAAACDVLDVSISGASIATPLRPVIGEEVVLGKLRGRIVRHHERGIGIEFIDIQNPTALRRYFG